MKRIVSGALMLAAAALPGKHWRLFSFERRI
jgi:hypothetical protein